MQTSKLRPLYSLTSLGNVIARTTATHTPIVNSAQQTKSWKEIPGPSLWDLIKQALPGASGDLNLTDGLKLGQALYDHYGPIVKLDGFLGRPPIILLYDPEQCAQVLRSENWLPIRSGFQSLDYYRRNKRNKGNENQSNPDMTGLLTDHGETWKKFRSTVNPVLLQPKTIKLYTSIIDEVAQDMIVRMKSLRGENNMIQSDFEMEMNLWSLESIALVALGRRLRCFDSHLPPNSPEKRLIQLVHDIFETADKLDFKPSLWRYFPTRAYKKAMKLYEEQENIARFFIDKTIEELNKQGTRKSEEEKSVLEKLLEINKDVAVIMASDVLFAGVDTTSNTITASLYLLANNQDKQDKLRAEILSITDENQKRSYLRACVKESMRIMPVVSGNIREATKEYVIFGYSIPPGIGISFMHQAMSMMEEHYPRPTEFLPERWLVKKGDPLYHGNAHPFVNQPFGFGVRSCIGRRIAELEIYTFLSRLIQNFRVEWFGPPMQTKVASINYITVPHNFIFKDA
ncbi:unnamed protein product [Chilo suppressalis]|uniref:Uncharacterized protein n=1 Tax=Chilo suppressalis TaxID=168631 RepID=A0ABN8L648_CHISP|nr:unnamed protein product [Chilo suppressalis]